MVRKRCPAIANPRIAPEWFESMMAVMKAKRSNPAPTPLVVVPPPPQTPLVAVRSARPKSAKRPADPRENPAARDVRGTANRTEIRREAPRVTAPRASQRPTERSGQPRSRKAGPAK
jgi:hypothetical protein